MQCTLPARSTARTPFRTGTSDEEARDESARTSVWIAITRFSGGWGRPRIRQRSGMAGARKPRPSVPVRIRAPGLRGSLDLLGKPRFELPNKARDTSHDWRLEPREE